MSAVRSGGTLPQTTGAIVPMGVTAVRSGGTPAPLDTPVPGLRGIGLEEMVDRAALLTRVDRKYVLRRAEVPAVLSGLDPATRVLEVDGLRTQSYRSAYLDTDDLAGYRSAATRRRRRFKVRTRTYADSDLSYLEVKTRGPRGHTVKERRIRTVGGSTTGPLDASERDWVDSLLVPLGCPPGTAGGLVPVLEVTYGRTTLLMGDGCGRATIDSGLEWVAPGRGSLTRPDLVIVETKSGSRPSDLDHLLWACGHRPTRISKYATALAALDDTLPANRWARVLRQEFTTAC